MLEAAAGVIGGVESLVPDGRTVWRGLSAGIHFLLGLVKSHIGQRDRLRTRLCGDVRTPAAIVVGASAAPLGAWGFALSCEARTRAFFVQCADDRRCPVDLGALRKAVAAKVANICSCDDRQEKWGSER